MFAVVQTGGKQYKVAQGDVITVEKLDGEQGASISFDQVLMRADEEGKEMTLGAPFIDGASVKGTIMEQGRAKKVTVIKYKPKVRYRRKKGHRQAFTKVKIETV